MTVYFLLRSHLFLNFHQVFSNEVRSILNTFYWNETRTFLYLLLGCWIIFWQNISYHIYYSLHASSVLFLLYFVLSSVFHSLWAPEWCPSCVWKDVGFPITLYRYAVLNWQLFPLYTLILSNCIYIYIECDNLVQILSVWWSNKVH